MTAKSKSPVLIYDGDCDICFEWVQYWRKLTGDRISYCPYQDVHSDYPAITPDEFKKAIKHVDVDGTIRSGAGATFALYRNVPVYSLLEWFYARMPGFAIVSELFYNFFSQHRGLLTRLTHLCWGRHHQPTSYWIISQLFLRLLACIYLAAFLSFGVQIIGLIGTDGVLPLDQYLLQLKQHLGTSAYWQTPMLFWFGLNDNILMSSCILGAILSCVLMFGVLQRTTLILLYLLYLSLFYAGQTFMTFQWDLLLLESGFLAIFLPTGSKIVVWLYRWLVFRFMFLGGLVKIISRDPTWDNLTALNYHFETQPLPTIFAWYAHHLPEYLLMVGAAVTLITELLLPFLIFTPRRFRITVACFFILFQLSILFTGNYNFFNLLTISLCLFLFDDAAIKKLMQTWLISRFLNRKTPKHSRAYRYIMYIFAIIILFSSLEQMTRLVSGIQSPLQLTKVISPWHFVQNYGPFAVMTTVRHEIVVEGSQDGSTWQEYRFKYKPGDISRGLPWVTPHQPRLDWQMWFAALSPPERNPWFRNFLYRLLTNSATVVDLLAVNPFRDTAPRFVRARFYEYHFSSPSQKASTGEWWTRTYVTAYSSPMRLTLKTDN